MPPPDEEKEASDSDPPTLTTPSAKPREVSGPERLTFTAPDPDDRNFKTPTRLVPKGSSVSVAVNVPEPGDVALDGLGLRQSADPRFPARFDLIAKPPGRWAVLYLPLRGDPRLIGRLQFGGG